MPSGWGRGLRWILWRSRTSGRFLGWRNATFCALVRPSGVRQTRNIVGDYVLTPEDLQTGPEFEDAIALKFETRVDTVFYHAAAKPGTDIPYRALLPKGLEGILVAGRCASMTAEAAGGVRAQGTVMQLGEAAGVAAAQAVRQGCHARYVDIKAVQQALVAIGRAGLSVAVQQGWILAFAGVPTVSVRALLSCDSETKRRLGGQVPTDSYRRLSK